MPTTVVDVYAPDIVCYARLEPSVMVADYRPSIQANVHDALWMLTQQLRVGEYQGTDGGTLIKAKIETQSRKLNRYRSTTDQPAELFNEQVPLEARIERLPFKMDLGFSLQLGYRWFKLLRIHLPGSDYRQDFIDAYPFAAIDGQTEPDKASNSTAMQIRKLTLTRAMNGVAFYEYLKGGGHASDTVPGVAAITAAEQDFLSWIENTFYVSGVSGDSSWSFSQLEYQCAISAPQDATQTASQTVLLADKYKRGNVDWYSFDLDPVSTDKLEEGPGIPIDNGPAILSPEVYTYIPHTIEFKGMPKGRWWEFEDKNIDLSKMMTQKQDISKMVVTEFGLIYSNDWFVIPHVVVDNTLTKVTGLVTTDVFGRQFLVNRAGDGIGWQKWDMYNISKKGTTDQESYDNLLMLAAIKNRMQSDPIEQVSFLRDEMSNMAWGVEEIVPDELMGGVDGKTAAQFLTDYLGEITNPHPSGSYLNNEALFRYRISNAVPENWIPFIPVKLGPSSSRNIVVRRATMHRYVSDNYTLDLVRPRTDILSYGLNTIPTQYYDINEEEVCRQGLSITANFQRTRWYNGQTYTWLGRTVKSGKGEGNSGLKFDILADKSADPNPIDIPLEGMTAWWRSDAANNVIVNGKVTSLKDNSGHGVDLSIWNGIEGPSFTTLNGMPALLFNDNILLNSSDTYPINGPNNFTIFHVASTGLGRGFEDISGSHWSISAEPSGMNIVLINASPNEYNINVESSSDVKIKAATLKQIRINIPPFSSELTYYDLNGDIIPNFNNPYSIPNSYLRQSGNVGFVLGATRESTNYLNGYFFETLVYNRVLSLAEIQQVLGYLKGKYNFITS